MMLSRSNLLLIALLAIQLVLLAISVVTSAGAEARPVEPILSGMSAADIEIMSFTDDLDNEVKLARRDDGWVLPGADDFPVDGAKVEAILGKIARLDMRRLVAKNRANFARLEVGEADFRRRITLESADDSAELYLGGSGGADTVYLRRAGEDNVYLGVGLNSWELSTQISTWLDASYVNVPQEDVLEISVSNAAGSYSFARDGDSLTYTGLAAGEAFEDTKMPIILRNAASIRLLAPLGLAEPDEYGLDEAQVTVDVRYRELVEIEEPAESEAESDEVESDEESSAGETEETEPEYSEETYTLTFGAQMEDGVVLKSSAAEYYVLVRDTVFNAFNDLRRSDLVKAPEMEGDVIEEGAE
ncbi:MAG: DUF4340 domain-containing protein [Chloroflexi bacterium]|nr:DUF4340 domain-containing protein [Chloroflexota bacterium]